MNNSYGGIIREWRPHPAAQASATLLGVVSTLVFLGLTSFVYRWSFVDPGIFANPVVPGDKMIGWLMVGMCGLVGVLIAINTLIGAIGYLRTRYMQYPDKVTDVAPQGLLGTASDEIYLRAIKSVTYSQTALGRIFGYRTISLHREGKETTYKLIAVPDRFGYLEFFQGIAARNMGSTRE